MKTAAVFFALLVTAKGYYYANYTNIDAVARQLQDFKDRNPVTGLVNKNYINI